MMVSNVYMHTQGVKRARSGRVLLSTKPTAQLSRTARAKHTTVTTNPSAQQPLHAATATSKSLQFCARNTPDGR